ncbi:hypothetical protein EDB81DRAFT_803542 [Dactylonectria macrodidyma]|uniref:Uncharacterized protein n=1 Tax=Dactylonectria macrodidyma TaxID=307937 RepID=A0A9P9EB70_9HYPO|nr:hypothetical protein EDB81DRAFT_803542 [Dactylonectria macrodidyma]
MFHMELLLHFSFAIYVPELDEDSSATSLILKTALTAPYLMHEVLALSARHLATIRPDNSGWYLHQAVDLQTKALTLFNNSHPNDSQDASVTRLLFSSILGRHILIDALAYRGPEFSQFLGRFIQGVRVHRGTRAVTQAHGWEDLLNSEIGPLMAKGIDLQRLQDPTPLHPHSQKLISQASSLSADERLACGTAVRMIETALDDVKSSDTSLFGLRIIFVWPILLPDEFLRLLEHQVPEAIAILGRYADLLQAGRHLWQIQDAGTYLSSIISDFSGSSEGM